MQLIHVKMKNGEDLLGYLGGQTSESIELITPISIVIDPHVGLFAKSWLLFSELNSVNIFNSDYMFFSAASRKAIDYYDEFMHKINDSQMQKQVEEDTDFNTELEEVFTAMMESRSTTKH